MDMSNIWRFDLRVGKSKFHRDGACLLDEVSWFEYGTLGDHPACVCPVIAAYGRVINDMLPDGQRQQLKRFFTDAVYEIAGSIFDGMLSIGDVLSSDEGAWRLASRSFELALS